MFFTGPQLQKKGISPYIGLLNSIKYAKDVSCIDHLSFIQNVLNVPVVAPGLPVGARLHQFRETWAALGASPKVITVLREGYSLPFWIWPNPTRSPTIISFYVHPLRNSYLMEALDALMENNAVEPVTTQKSLVLHKTFPGSKIQQPVKTFFDLRKQKNSNWKYQRQ